MTKGNYMTNTLILIVKEPICILVITMWVHMS